jgi:WD40 repeat protein
MDGSSNPALWDLASGEVLRTYYGFGGAISPGAVAISPDSRYIAGAGFELGTGEASVKIWDLESGQLKCDLQGLTENGRAVAFSPDSAYLLAGSQVPNGNTGHLILWDVATGKEIKRFSYADNGTALDAAFGPGDRTVLSTGVGEIYLWDIITGLPLERYTGITAIPWSMAISPDSRYVLSGSLDGEVILWDFTTGEQLGRENIQNAVFSVAFSPDSKIAYAASMNGKLIKWQISVKSLPELLDWIKVNRYIRPLTEDEKLQYHIEP